MTQPKQPPEWERLATELQQLLFKAASAPNQTFNAKLNRQYGVLTGFLQRTLATEREKVLKEVMEGLPPQMEWSQPTPPGICIADGYNQYRTAVLTYLQTLLPPSKEIRIKSYGGGSGGNSI